MQTGLVKGLSPKGRWKVVVRLARIWENKNREKILYELGLLFVDRQGNMIEGCLPENNIKRFGDRLKEGLLYEIESFILTGARNSYRLADHAFRIKIGQQTKIAEIDPPPEDFPYYAHNAKPFEVLEKRIKQTGTLSDVIGIAYRVTEILASKSGHDSRRQIYIKNDNDRPAVVTLWGELAESFDAQSLYEASMDRNMAILFVGMVVDNFSGMLAFKSTHLTQWHFNPLIPEAKSLHESLQHEHYVIEWEGHGPAETAITEATLSELANSNLDDIVGKSFNLKVRVTQINNPTDWWFYACTKCYKKMVLTGGVRKCPVCKGNTDNQRYKISLRAEDIHPTNTDKEVISDFIFFGSHGLALTGHDVSLLVSQVRGCHDYTPPAIADVVGKAYDITAEVNQDTYDKQLGHMILKVSKVQPLVLTLPAEEVSPQPSLPALPSSSLEATPVKHVLSSPLVHAEREVSSATDAKKRKESLPLSEASAKRADTAAKGTSKALFQTYAMYGLQYLLYANT